MAAETAMKMYPRGFIGRVFEGPIDANPSPFKERFQRMTPTFNITQEVQTISPVVDVVELYEELLKDGMATRRSSYQERVIKTAAACFGTYNFKQWCEWQLKSPNFSDLHMSFIEETLDFVLGAPRKLHLESHIRMLNQPVTAGKFKAAKELSPKVQLFFKDGNNMANTVTSDIILLWLSRDGGLEDLVQSLYVFFGKY